MPTDSRDAGAIMSEPESLDTDEALPKRIERHWFDRLIMLSDGVFAIAMTLLALEVRPPHAWSGEIGDLIVQIWRPLFGYALSFMIVAVFWFSNRSILARVRRVDGPFSVLTLLFLCLIGLTPFATALMAEQGPAKSMKVYSILVGSTGAVQALLWSYAAFWRNLLDAAVSRSERWITLVAFLTLPLMFCISGLVVRPGGSEYALLPVAGLAFFVGRMRRRLGKERSGGETA
ncbi:TMEM175 family protein [soil metagenome]